MKQIDVIKKSSSSLHYGKGVSFQFCTFCVDSFPSREFRQLFYYAGESKKEKQKRNSDRKREGIKPKAVQPTK